MNRLIGVWVALVALIVVTALLIISHNKREIADLQQRLEISQAAQKGSEQALNVLKETNASLLKTLETWKQEYAEITKQNQDAKNEIAELERQSKAVADILHGIIPDDLWIRMFPKNGNDLRYQD